MHVIEEYNEMEWCCPGVRVVVRIGNEKMYGQVNQEDTFSESYVG